MERKFSCTTIFNDELSDEVLFRQDLDPRCVQQAKQEKCRTANYVVIFTLFF
jgi:hypothetical protein